MLRFIALIRDRTDVRSFDMARFLGERVRVAPGWQSVLHTAGMHVFATGLRAGREDAHLLLPDRGIVLGKLFRRSDVEVEAAPSGHLSRSEQARIVDSGGQHLVDAYWGRYVAFLRLPHGEDSVLRDPAGALGCFHLKYDGVTIVFSWLEDVLRLLPSVPVPAIDWQQLAAHIRFVSLSGRTTALQGVTQVLPGERVEPSGPAPTTASLWDAVAIAAKGSPSNPTSAAAVMARTVTQCVRAWAGCHDTLLLRLSGGLDSSILLGCLQALDGPRIHCLNYHSPGSNSDERAYARLAAQRSGCELIELERDTSFDLATILQLARTPFPGSYLGRLGTAAPDAAVARRLGASALFTGGGGDQLFFEFSRWWPAADHLHDRGLDGGLGRAVLQAARMSGLSVWAVLRRLWLDSRGVPDPEDADERHLTLANLDALPPQDQWKSFAHPAHVSAQALPIGKRIHLQQLLYPSDTGDPFAVEGAPELLNPLLSQPVVELCLALPTYTLTHGGMGRGLARMAFADRLPREIARRRAKGGMEEHTIGILQRNLAFARSILLDGRLVGRGLLDRARLEQALIDQPSTLGAYTGEVHIYLGVEAWLQRFAA